MLFTIAQSIRIMPEGYGAVAFKDQTTLHPLGLAMTVASGLTLLSIPRRYTVWPFIFLACFVSPAQRLVVANLDFNLIRLLVLFGFARLLMRSEYLGIRRRPLDYVVIAYALSTMAIYTIQQSSFSAFVYQAGHIFDSIGMYVLMRCFIRTPRDISTAALGFAVASIPVVIAFIIENQTGRNVFSMFGGVPEITAVRAGRLRAQGAFAHPIIAGCFWAASLPLIASLWWRSGTSRYLAVIGSVCAISIVGFTASSTPVMGLLMGLFGAATFFIRHRVRWLFFGGCLLAIALHMVMKAPVWHLISRFTITRGNTGYHRYLVIDAAVERFGEWWLLGTQSTAHWFWGGQDITNQYVAEGVLGGLLGLVLFLVMIILSFVAVGRSWRIVQRSRPLLMLCWALGVALFVHCTSFFGVFYFGQGIFLWYLHLAMIGSLDEFTLVNAKRSRFKLRKNVAAAAGASHIQSSRRQNPSVMEGDNGSGGFQYKPAVDEERSLE